MKSESGKQVLTFLLYLIKNNNAWDVIIFLTRKGYWLYRMACWYLGIKFPDGKVIVSDRKIDKGDIQEIRNQVKKSDAVVYIVDDTLSTGATAYRIYDLVKRGWPEAKIFPIACFLSVSLDEMKNYLSIDDTKPGNTSGEFINNMGYYYKASPMELGRFSYEQALIAQRELVPYVVDLPFMVDGSYRSDEPLSCFNECFDANGICRVSDTRNSK